jgi:hypothetical protein
MAWIVSGLLMTPGNLAAQGADAGAITELVVIAAANERKFTDFTRVHADSSRQSFMRCPDAPSTCRLDRDRPAVQASHPVVQGGRATVYVTTWEPTNSRRQPVYRITRRYELARQDRGWVIERSSVESTT